MHSIESATDRSCSSGIVSLLSRPFQVKDHRRAELQISCHARCRHARHLRTAHSLLPLVARFPTPPGSARLHIQMPTPPSPSVLGAFSFFHPTHCPHTIPASTAGSVGLRALRNAHLRVIESIFHLSHYLPAMEMLNPVNFMPGFFSSANRMQPIFVFRNTVSASEGIPVVPLPAHFSSNPQPLGHEFQAGSSL